MCQCNLFLYPWVKIVLVIHGARFFFKAENSHKCRQLLFGGLQKWVNALRFETCVQMKSNSSLYWVQYCSVTAVLWVTYFSSHFKWPPLHVFCILSVSALNFHPCVCMYVQYINVCQISAVSVYYFHRKVGTGQWTITLSLLWGQCFFAQCSLFRRPFLCRILSLNRDHQLNYRCCRI
jgi:hypothetical protein